MPRIKDMGDRKGSWVHRRWIYCLPALLFSGLSHAGTHHYYYTDPQGTVLAKTDANGNIIATYDYTPYGTAVANMGPAPNGPGYTGHVNDADTGLVYMQARYYDPSAGRFLTADLIKPTAGNMFNFNRYGYVNNNPITGIDPTGMYNCDTKKDKVDCDMVKKARERTQRARNSYASRSPQAKALQKILDAVGTENDGNTVSIIFGTVDKYGSNAQTTYDKNAGILVKFDPKALQHNFSGNPIELAATFAHEGQHIVDAISWQRNPAPGPERFQTEFNAYMSQSYINQAFKTASPYGVWDPSWPAFIAGTFRNWTAEENANCDAYSTC
jgi:RHS repeat-associated protein